MIKCGQWVPVSYRGSHLIFRVTCINGRRRDTADSVFYQVDERAHVDMDPQSVTPRPLLSAPEFQCAQSELQCALPGHEDTHAMLLECVNEFLLMIKSDEDPASTSARNDRLPMGVWLQGPPSGRLSALRHAVETVNLPPIIELSVIDWLAGYDDTGAKNQDRKMVERVLARAVHAAPCCLALTNVEMLSRQGTDDSLFNQFDSSHLLLIE